MPAAQCIIPGTVGDDVCRGCTPDDVLRLLHAAMLEFQKLMVRGDAHAAVRCYLQRGQFTCVGFDEIVPPVTREHCTVVFKILNCSLLFLFVVMSFLG